VYCSLNLALTRQLDDGEGEGLDEQIHHLYHVEKTPWKVLEYPLPHWTLDRANVKLTFPTII
jgi:hypothetical protein